MRHILMVCLLLVCGGARAEDPKKPSSHAEIHAALKKQWSKAIPPFTVADADPFERARLRKLPAPSGKGVYVSGSLTGDAPFEDGCLLKGIDGRKVGDAKDLKTAIADLHAGQTIQVEALVYRAATLKPRRANRWEKVDSEIRVEGVWDFIEGQIRRRTDPADKSDWIEPKEESVPVQLAVHRSPGAKAPSLMMRLTYLDERRILADRFDVSLGRKTFEFPEAAGQLTRDGSGRNIRESAVFDISERPELIDAFLEGELDSPNIVRFQHGKTFADKAIDPEHLLANRAIIHAYYAERFGREK